MTKADLDRIVEFDLRFPRAYSNYLEKPYGVVYYDRENPDLHDANHAIICQGGDYDRIIRDIVRSFENYKIGPRIYSRLIDSRLDEMREALQKYGFKLQEYTDAVTMSLQNGTAAVAPYTLSFRRVRALDDNIAEIARCEDMGGLWNVKKRRKLLRYPWSHYLVGFDARNRAVTACGIECFMGRTARIDDVVTHPDHRGKGYARQLMGFAVEYASRLDLDLLYLTSDNPTAVKIYGEAGFAEAGRFEHWEAWKE